MRTWFVVLGGLATLVAAACTGSGGSASGDGAAAEPATVVGETDQGLRLRADLAGDHQVSVRVPANCGGERGEAMPIPLHWRRFEAAVSGDGSFEVDEAYTEEGTDGDYDEIEVRIAGDFAADGTATGTLEASIRSWNGQGQEFSDPCETGTVAWTADPVGEADNLVVPTPDSMSLAPVGDDLAALSDSVLMRIDATGEAHPVTVGAPAAPAPIEGDPNVPPSTLAGGTSGEDPAAPAAPIWLQERAVVADGVWMVDPATGAVSRFELADGTRTATLAEPLDDMAAAPDALWTVSTNAFHSGYALDKRDPVTGAVLASTPVERGTIVAGPTDADVWYVDATLAGGRLTRVDSTTLAFGEVFEVDISQYDGDPVASQDHVWWLDRQTLMSIDLASGQVDPVDLPSRPWAMAADATGVWVLHEQEAVARRVENGQVVRTVDLPDPGWDVAVTADGAVWLASGDAAGGEPGVMRLDPALTAG